MVQESVFDLFSHLATVSSLISNADSESIVRFEIGPAEVPQMAISGDQKWRFQPVLGSLYFLYFKELI